MSERHEPAPGWRDYVAPGILLAFYFRDDLDPAECWKAVLPARAGT